MFILYRRIKKWHIQIQKSRQTYFYRFLLFSYYYFLWEVAYFTITRKKSITIEKYDELNAICKLKVDRIVNWRKELLKNIQRIYNNQAIIIHISEYVHGVDRATNYQIITIWVKELMEERDYSRVLLIDQSGKTIIKMDPVAPLTESNKRIIE